MIMMTCWILVKSPGPGGWGCPSVTGLPADGEQPAHEARVLT
jgi:hypothetical protein